MIDDDEISYSVDRLKTLKSAHEQHSSQPTDAEQAAFALVVDQSVNPVGQSGGISAHTVNAEAIHVHSAPRSTLAEEKATQAIEVLWQIMLALKAEFSAVTFADTILTPDELQAGFRNSSTRQPFDTLVPYRLMETVTQKYERAGGEQAEAQRPFVSRRLYGIFYATQAVICRSGVLVHFSWEERRYRAWRGDSGIAAHLRSVLPEGLVVSLLAQSSFGLVAVVNALEEAFLAEAERYRAGLRAG